MTSPTSSPETSLLFDNCSYLDTTTLSGTTETQILASAYLSLVRTFPDDTDQAIIIDGAVYLTPGSGCTGLQLRLRQGFGLGGGIDFEISGLYLPPGKLGCIPIHGIMNPTVYIPGPGQYTVTVQQDGGTVGNGTIQQAGVAFTYVGFNH